MCGWRGHVTPAASAEEVDGPLVLGVEVEGHGVAGPWRLARCVRCDAWLAVVRPEPGTGTVLPPPELLHIPRRGRALRAAVIERLIAVERGLHCVAYAAVAVLAAVLRADLGGVQSWVRRLLSRLTNDQTGAGAAFNGSFLVREGNRLLRLRRSELTVLLIVAAAYAVVEGAEAVGLWRERRWAEYLTCVATAGFIPFEGYELASSVTWLKVTALVLNVVILVYLVWSKRLFGLGRVWPPRHEGKGGDPRQLLSTPLVAVSESEPRGH